MSISNYMIEQGTDDRPSEVDIGLWHPPSSSRPFAVQSEGEETEWSGTEADT